MKYKVGDVVIGKITGIQPYGAFVSLPDSSSGLIHISEISDDFVRDVHFFVRENEEVEVKVIDIDNINHQYRLSLKATRIHNRAKIRFRKKYKLPQQTIGFRSLEVSLPQWIESKMKEKEND